MIVKETLKSKELELVHTEYDSEYQTFHLIQWDFNKEGYKGNEVKMDLYQIEQLNALTTQILLRENTLENKLK